MWSRFLVKRQSFRSFSTFSKIKGNSILLSNSNPTRIKIPINSTQCIDYPVVDIEKEVPGLKIHKDPDVKMEDLIQKRFEVSINHKTYTVHPDLSTMMALKNREKVEEILGEHQFPGVRRSILSMFLDHLVSQLPDKPVSRTELKEIITKAIQGKN